MCIANTELPCRALPANNPTPHPATYQLQLQHVETQLVEISSRVQILESGDLLISNIRPSDAGLYICVRANEAGSVKGEAFLSVLGEYYPANSRPALLPSCVCYPRNYYPSPQLIARRSAALLASSASV